MSKFIEKLKERKSLLIEWTIVIITAAAIVWLVLGILNI